ncbi:hypothetical protein V6N11_081331 [Hibiscus sabdariffa]|uniref:Uncharacterized protein n=1 Tax=Hibiscus sabdariffa TaxID=183260 RepID=A0ABR2QK28_9ROSI
MLNEDAFPASTHVLNSSSSSASRFYSQPLHVLPDGNSIGVSSVDSPTSDNAISGSDSSHAEVPATFSSEDCATTSHGTETENSVSHEESVSHEAHTSSENTAAQEEVLEENSVASIPLEHMETTEVPAKFSDVQHEVDREDSAEVFCCNTHHMVTRN